MKEKKRGKKTGLKMKELHSPVSEKKSVITPIPDRLNTNTRFDNSYQSCSSDVSKTDYVDLLEASDVVIKDVGTSSASLHSPLMSSVTTNLRLCKKHVMHPYYKLLFMIGWRPFGKNCHQCICLMKAINILFPLLVMMLLFFCYIIEIITCEGRLTGVALFQLDRNDLKRNSSLNLTHNNHPLNTTDAPTMHHRHHGDEFYCRHFFGSYILPAVFHALAYLVGLYHFRFQENEGFYSVMEKVYLQSTQPSRITQRLRSFMLIGIIWLIFGTSMSILMFYTYGLSAVTGVPASYPIWRIFFTCLLFLGSLMTNCVNVCVVINYGGQCQLLIFYLKHIESILVEKSVSLKDAMKKLLDIKANIQRLNSLLGWSASFMIIAIFLSIIINSGKMSRHLDAPFVKWGYRCGFCLQGILIVLFSLFQACRVTSTGASFKINLLSMRCYGYQHYNQMEIDSFINFLSLIKLETKLFSIPMKSRYLIGVMVLTTISLFIIYQLSPNNLINRM